MDSSPQYKISLDPLSRAIKSLNDALREPFSPIVRDATIQRFEYTFELSWKMLKRYFQVNNQTSEANLKNIFREAGKQGIIENVEQWFEFLHFRNLTSHTYDESTAQEVFEAAKNFSGEAEKVLRKLEVLIG